MDMHHSVGAPLEAREFKFGGHSIHVQCRRMPDEVASVTQTLQLDLNELWSSFFTFPSDRQAELAAPAEPAAEAAAAAPPGTAGSSEPPVDSKILCCGKSGPDLIGLDIWPASIALGNYLAAHPQLAAGKRVLELGAGMGLPGLLCAKLGAAAVVLTDYEQLVVDQLEQSGERNGVGPLCEASRLDWLDLSTLAPARRGTADLLLLADVIYAEAVVGPLVATLLAALHPQGAALIAHRIRRPLVLDRALGIAKLQEQDDIFQRFVAACGAAGLAARMLSSSPAALEGKEPLLLAVGRAEAALRPFEPADLPAAQASD